MVVDWEIVATYVSSRVFGMKKQERESFQRWQEASYAQKRKKAGQRTHEMLAKSESFGFPFLLHFGLNKADYLNAHAF